MNKKIMLASVLALYLSFIIISPMALAEESSESTTSMGLFTSELGFDITEPVQEPVTPGQVKEVKFNVKFKLDMGSLAKWFLTKRRIGRMILFGPGYILKLKGQPKATVNLTIAELPTWCNATLDPETIEFDFDNQYVEQEVKLAFKIDKEAPALENSSIKVQADFAGHWTIKGASNTTTISFTPSYIPEISVEAESELTVPPLENATIPINITNKGNGQSKITVQITKPESWSTFFGQEEITLDVNETGQIILTVLPSKDFTNNTLDLSFVSKSTAGEYQSDSVTLTIKLNDDGSLKEEGNLDFIIILGIVIVVIIVLIVSIIVFRKKKQ